MIYLKKSKPDVLIELAHIASTGCAFMTWPSFDEPASEAKRVAFRNWFNEAVNKLTMLVEPGSAVFKFMASYFEHRWRMTGDGQLAQGDGRSSTLYQHVHQPLTAFLEIMGEVENAPDDSDAIEQLQHDVDEFRLHVANGFDKLGADIRARLGNIQRLAEWSYADLEVLFLKVAGEDLKTEDRKLLEKYGPRLLAMFAQFVGVPVGG